jgi:hypothetical protein
MNQIFQSFCRIRFGLGPLHYHPSRSDFCFKFAEIFVIEKRLPDSVRGVSCWLDSYPPYCGTKGSDSESQLLIGALPIILGYIVIC